MYRDSDLHITSRQLCSRDPLAKLLLILSRQSTLRVMGIAIAVYGVAVVAAGSLISFIYQKAGYRFLSIFDQREFPVVLINYLIIVPFIWAFYTWQPIGVLQVFHKLYQNGVIGKSKRETTVHTYIQQTVSVPFNKTYNLIIALVITLASLVIYPFAAHSPRRPFFYGFSVSWWVINPYYSWAIRIPLLFINVYMGVWVIIRQAIAITSFTKLFHSFEIVPKPFHPDQCNGLGVVGDYAIRSTWMAVLIGVRLSVMISFPMLFGQPINMEADTIISLIVYFVAIPSLLIPPVWEAHLAMRKAKDKALETVAVQIRGLLSEVGISPEQRIRKTKIQVQMRKLLPEVEITKSTASTSLIEQLERKYRLIDEVYRTWPFRTLDLKRLGIAVIIPLLSTAASGVIDALLK